MRLFEIMKAKLDLFEGGAAAGTSGASTDGAVSQGAVNSQDANIPWELVGGKPTEITGDNAVSNSEVVVQEEPPVVADSWEKAKELYGEDYKQDVEKQVKRRLKSATTENQKLKTANDGYQQLADFIAARYPNVDKSNPVALLEAMKGDDTYLRQRAIDNGTTVEQERAAYERDVEVSQIRERAERAEQALRAADIQRQESVVKKKYPDFDLSSALENPDFCDQLAFTRASKGKEDVMAAYEAAFREQILEAAVQQSAKKTKEAVSQNMRANQFMPSPPGNNSGHQATQNDVHQYSVDEIVAMAEQGVDISKLFR